MKLIDSLKFEGKSAFSPAFKKRPISSFLRTVVGSMVALMLGGAMMPAVEAAVYTRFDNDNALDDWKVVHNGTASNKAGIYDDFGDGKALRITRPRTGGATGDSAAVFYDGSGDGIIDGKVADFELKSTMAFGFSPVATGLNSFFGFVFRASAATYSTSNGYYLAYNQKVDANAVASGFLVLYDKPGAHGVPGTELASVDLDLDPDTYYVFKITAVGTSITASVWDEDESTLLGELVFQDDSVRTNAGYLGARAAFANTNVTQYVKDISITVIPEPATVAFSLIGGAAMLVVLRRRAA